MEYCDSDVCPRDDKHAHNLDDYECGRDDCDAAYTHPLLLDYHIVTEHAEEVEAVINGENSISLN